MLLNDPCGDQLDDEYADDEENYSFSVLCESDDEADEADGGMGDSKDLGDMNSFGSPTGKLTGVEEINELLLSDGKLDYSAAGRKHAKRITSALKKQQADAKKSALKKEKEEKAKKAKAAKKVKASGSSSKSSSTPSKDTSQKKSGGGDVESSRELKDLEKRRKKRERERLLKEKDRNAKRAKTEGSSVVKRGRKLGIVNKRGRATAIIEGYLHRLAAKTDIKGLGLSGVFTTPAASVEGTGLLGMALAFRAAAGELEMPNVSDNSSSFKPWENIDIDGRKDEGDRCSNLEKKIKMIEDAIATLKKNDMRRRKLIESVKKEQEVRYKNILKAEKDARQNDMPKRKPVAKKAVSSEVVKDDGKKTEVVEIVKDDDDNDDKKDDETRKSEDNASNNNIETEEDGTLATASPYDDDDDDDADKKDAALKVQ